MSLTKNVLLVLILGALLGLRFYSFYQQVPVYTDGQEIELTMTLQEEPEVNHRGQKFRLKTPSNQYFYITTTAFPQYHFGDMLLIKGTMTITEYEGRTLYLLKYPKIAVAERAVHPLVSLAASVRKHTKTLYESTLPPISASLLMGIVFGAREHFPDDFWSALQTTGVLHVIAASGMNVTFVSAALLFMLGTFLQRKVTLIIGCLGIIFYLFLVGFEPSIVRATLMGILAFAASLFGRQHLAFYAALISAYVMLLAQPGFLFDLGFQLSFGATLSILFVKPFLDENMPERLPILRDTVTTTLAAQIGTMPILLGVFGQVGLLSLAVNALVLWTIPLVMLFGALAACIAFVAPGIAQLLLFFCLPLLLLFEWLVSFFGKSEWVLHISTWHWGLTVGYYGVLCAVIILRKPQQKSMSLEESFALEKY